MIDNQRLMALAAAAAQAAGDLQMQRIGQVMRIEYKGEANIVTEVDKASEDLIVQMIHAQFPDHDIVSEESDIYRKQSDIRWYIDPLDGTTNYAHGFPFFAVSIGCHSLMPASRTARA